MAEPEKDSIRLVNEPLDAGAAVAAVSCAEAGGIDLFVGTTRAESDPQDGGRGALLRLDYEAYPEMALAQMEKLVQRARERWPIARAVVWHRTGAVAVGEASVVIAVSCPHRAEAFESCRFLIDELKKAIPIWKKEVYEGEARWQGESAGG
ncbi:MAG TPA: molybdenum cofactor biosynthesis protein MoaE [Phycisphaerae bacterium]|nr:molybdenum cofactor biosynthesis protein MoaE [Phycisphaerae bacterium]